MHTDLLRWRGREGELVRRMQGRGEGEERGGGDWREETIGLLVLC